MVSLKIPPMVILCVLLWDSWVQIFSQEDAEKRGMEGLARWATSNFYWIHLLLDMKILYRLPAKSADGLPQ